MRISVVGTSGSGKTTLGRAAAQRLGVPFLELDSIRHQPNWQELPDDEFRRRTDVFTSGDAWVLDGNYRTVRDLVDPRATHIVWLNLPRWRVMLQIVRRSVGRVVFKRELWNGNRETWRNLLSLDPMESVIVWSWTTHARRTREYGARVDGKWVVLRSRREAELWLESLSP